MTGVTTSGTSLGTVSPERLTLVDEMNRIDLTAEVFVDPWDSNRPASATPPLLNILPDTTTPLPVGEFEAMETTTVNAEDATAVNNLRKYFKKEQYAKALELCDKSKSFSCLTFSPPPTFLPSFLLFSLGPESCGH
jgi:hypothetical protein